MGNDREMKVLVFILTMIVLLFLNIVGFGIGSTLAKKIINNEMIVNAIAGACALIPTISILINGDYSAEVNTRAPEIVNIIFVVLITILFVRDAKLKTDTEKDKQNKTITENNIKKDS